MAVKIILTPELLKSQSSEMTQLMGEYESLFAEVTSTLNQTNSNWSENLSRNFAGKISSAQKNFAGIVEMLNKGASAAMNSAVTMESVDQSLSKAIGNASAVASGSGGGHTIGGGRHDGGSQGEKSDYEITLEILKKRAEEAPEPWDKPLKKIVAYLEDWQSALSKDIAKRVTKTIEDKTARRGWGKVAEIEIESILRTVNEGVGSKYQDSWDKAWEMNEYYRSRGNEALSTGDYAEALQDYKMALITRLEAGAVHTAAVGDNAIKIIRNDEYVDTMIKGSQIKDFYVDRASDAFADGNIKEGFVDIGKASAYGWSAILSGVVGGFEILLPSEVTTKVHALQKVMSPVGNWLFNR